MPMPKATKTKYSAKNGKVALEFTNNVDAVNWTLKQLIYMANRDVGIYLSKSANANAKNTLKGFLNLKTKRINPSGRMSSKDVSPAFQYWSRKQENDLLVGIKHGTWYGADQELGTNNQPKKAILYNTVKDNIDNIRKIQAQYLSAISDEIEAKRIAEEAENIQEFE